MSHETDLLRGVAELLEDAGVGVYDETGPLPAEGTGIVLGRLPDGPDRALGLTTYPVADDYSTDSITGVQARMRAGTAPLDVLDLSDAVFDVLHNRRRWDARGVRVEISWRNSEAWIGQDASGRMERTANYYFRTVRSGPHTID
ncbi:MAG TPA: minor capsid protein [Ornithinicoccus sp.]|nr:minor capsid protein [Ornithinicoccus sp.]